MYRIYLRDSAGNVSEKTNTTNPDAAAAAFTDLVNRADLDGQKLAVALTYHNRQLAFHRFDREPGQADYWRDRTDKIAWPTVGRPSSDGRRTNIMLSDDDRATAEQLGGGNVSEGIRIALAAARDSLQSDR